MADMQKLGRYELVREIGRGAMGVVYQARDPVLDRTVAIKTVVLSSDPAEREDYEARFQQEARAAGGLAHPNIVTIYDVGNAGGLAFMAMEYLEGEELGRLMANGIAVDRAVDIAAQIAEGLAYAHEREVVHRDIKPPNIMVLRDGLVKIADFGIARLRANDVKTQTGMLLGSPRYMSPEVFLGKRADAKSDIFSLGIILYEMLTGSAPFTGDSVTALMYQVINFVPPAPSTVRSPVPPMLDFIIAKMLAKQPESRYASAREVAVDLRDCARRISEGSAPPVTTLPPASLSSEDVAVLASTDEREQLLARTMPLARADDTLASAAAPAPTLGVSREFESLLATQRLVMRLDEGEKPATQTSPRYRVVSGLGTGGSPWSRYELAVFSSGVLLASVAAVAIAIV
jgi:eukaryotic-like serine/threonine-protein kinase